MSQEVTEIAVAIAQPLQVASDQIIDYLKVHIGDVVNKQSILASKKGMFGLGGMELKSPVEGIVHNIDLERGVIIINLGSEKSLLPILQQQNQQQSVELKPEKKKLSTGKFKRTASSQYEAIQGVFGISSASGIGWLIEYNFGSQSILPEMEHRVLLITNMPTLANIYKASAIGVAGIVVASKDLDGQFLHQLQQELHGKSRMGFLVLPAGSNLATLHGVLLEIDGPGKQLLFEKK